MAAEPSGLLLWFDPMVEVPKLFELEPSLRGECTPVMEKDDLADQLQYQQLSLLGELPSEEDV